MLNDEYRPGVARTRSVEDAEEAVEAGEGVLRILGWDEQQEEDHDQGAHLLGCRCAGHWSRNWHQQGAEHRRMDEVGSKYTNQLEDYC